MSEVEYNEIGQSKTKHIGSTGQGPLPATATFLQHVNYRYNERGWLSTINNPANLTDPAGGFDVFAEGLDYDKNNNGYTGISQISYNGNITSLSWQTKTPASLTPPFAQEQKGYIFTYDALNQLTNSVSQASTSGVGIYNEAVAYDDLGNITTLIRKNSAVGPPLNSLTYNYTTGGIRSNRLLSVTDAGSEAQSSTYTYDTNGSLISDSKKLITTSTPIVYNELSLPSLVTFNTSPGKTLTYKYDATGKKLERVTTVNAAVTENRVYDDGIEYAGTTASTIDFVHTAEGRAIPSAGAYNYQYQVADHLGNIRALFADANNNGLLTADEIIQFSDYYPFGREINYNLSLPLNPANNYKYNGKEFQNDLSEYDYGARFYDAVIGRWNVVDPMAEVNRRWTPYNYAVNNPVRNIDPDGMESFTLQGASAREFLGAYREATKEDGTDKKDDEKPIQTPNGYMAKEVTITAKRIHVGSNEIPELRAAIEWIGGLINGGGESGTVPGGYEEFNKDAKNYDNNSNLKSLHPEGLDVTEISQLLGGWNAQLKAGEFKFRDLKNMDKIIDLVEALKNVHGGTDILSNTQDAINGTSPEKASVEPVPDTVYVNMPGGSGDTINKLNFKDIKYMNKFMKTHPGLKQPAGGSYHWFKPVVKQK